MALTGKNFCMAAKDGFEIVWANGIRYMVVGGIGEIIMFIGKLLIVLATTCLFYIMITFIPEVKASILEPILMLAVNILLIFRLLQLFHSQLEWSSCQFTVSQWILFLLASLSMRPTRRLKELANLHMHQKNSLLLWMFDQKNINRAIFDPFNPKY